MSVYSLCLPALMKSLPWNNVNSEAKAGPPSESPQRIPPAPRGDRPRAGAAPAVSRSWLSPCHAMAWILRAPFAPFPATRPHLVPPTLLSHSPGSACRCPHPCHSPFWRGTHSPVQLPLLRAGDKSRARCLCSGSGRRGPGRRNPPERNQQLNTFTSPLICRFCHKIPLQRV